MEAVQPLDVHLEAAMPHELHELEATPLCVACDIAWQTAVTQTLHTSTSQHQHGAANLNLPCESRLHR